MDRLIREFKVGCSNVMRSLKQFIPFFVAAFIIESLFISLLTVGWSIERYYYRSISDDYTYHYILEGMDDATYTVFHNKLIDLDPVEGQIASDLKHESYKTYDGIAHRVYVTLNKSNPLSQMHFNQALEAARSDAPYSFTCVESPLTVRNSYLTSNRVVIVTLWVIVFLISVFLLVSVYRVRISHYRFMYGVYMTCGADYKKLVFTAIAEMLTVFAIALIPAFLFSVLVVMLIFRNTVMTVSFISPVLPIAIVSAVAVIVSAVGVPMRIVASDMPINLINKGGTAEYVISPRRSAKLFGKSFPFFYELLSIRRFAKYYAMLLTMCVVLNSLFITGLYAGELSDDIREADTGTLQIECPTGFDDEELIAVSEAAGVDYVMWDNSVLGLPLLSYLKVDESKNLSGQIYSVDADEGYDATFAIKYRSLDSLLVKTLIENGLAFFEGDPYELFKDDGILRVVISRDISNVERFDFNVGDEITVCLTDSSYEPATTEKFTDNRDLLARILSERAEGIAPYTDLKLKVCAIVDYATPESNLILGVSSSVYKIIGGNPDRNLAEIHTSSELTTEEESSLYDRLAGIISIYRDWRVSRTFNALIDRLASDTYILGVFVAVALFVLIGVPVLWLFSQKVFYEKREDEIELLRCIGADENRLFKLYLSDGLCVALIAFVFTMIFSALLSGFIYGAATLILPFFGFEGVWKLEFELSPVSLLISALVCTLCGFTASMLAYIKGRKSRTTYEKEYMESRNKTA